MPAVPPPQKNLLESEQPQANRWLSLLVGLMLAGLVTVITALLVSPLLVIVPVFATIFWLQYVLWGRWLERYYANYRAELEAAEQQEEDRRSV